MTKEIFKDIPNYEGKYQISNKGTVKNLLRNKTTRGSLNNQGYMKTILTKDGVEKTIKIHQLVAMGFLGHTPCGYKLVVDHIDHNPLNNNLENLQVITHRENLSKRNKKPKKASSQYTGVCWNKQDSKWTAALYVKSKRFFLGYFKTEIEAHNAYQNKLKEILGKLKNSRIFAE